MSGVKFSIQNPMVYCANDGARMICLADDDVGLDVIKMPYI